MANFAYFRLEDSSRQKENASDARPPRNAWGTGKLLKVMGEYARCEYSLEK